MPGQRLIEADLTRELSVSRGPVREALKRLAGEGVLTITRHRGAYVRAQSRRDVEETLVVLEALTGLAARLASQNVDFPGNRTQLEQMLESLLRFQGRGESVEYFQTRRAFYACLIDMGGNRELARLMPQMQINLLRLQFQSYITGEQQEQYHLQYRAIAQAVLAGNATLAEKETRKHLRHRLEDLVRLPDSAFAAAQAD